MAAVDVAFVGRRVSAEEIRPWRVAMILEVERVYKGQVGPRIEVHTNTETNCALYLTGKSPPDSSHT